MAEVVMVEGMVAVDTGMAGKVVWGARNTADNW